MKPAPRLPLTKECHHYYEIGEVPWDIQKYWHQRYSIFSYYDDEIQLTDDAWFGVTPEPVATTIATDLSARHPPSRTTLVDLFAGAGGNVIAFALSGRWQRIVAVERDAATLACAQHNAEAYGVPEGAITWIHGDCFEYLALLKKHLQLQQSSSSSLTNGNGNGAAGAVRVNGDGDADSDLSLDPQLAVDPASTVVFASPPWGGVSYRDQDVFDLSTMQPYNLRKLHDACAPFEHALYLPRTSDLRQIARLVPEEDRKIDVVQYCMEGASKAMVAYIPGTATAATTTTTDTST